MFPLIALPLLLQAANAPIPAAPEPVPEPLRTAFASALQRVPALASATGRVLQPALRGFAPEGAPFPLWVVELQWAEQGKTHPAVALIADVPAAAKARGEEEATLMPDVLGREGAWGVVSLFEDKTFAEWRVQMQGARRAAYEAAAVGDIRTVISAQMAYAYSNDNAYDDLRCLASPRSCIADFEGEPFVDQAMTNAERNGYRRTFHPGASAKGKSKSSLAAFAFTAVPLVVGETGERGFCGDSSGRICFTADGSAPRVESGRCADPCQVLK
jgi:hypothetical protein